MIKVGMNFKLLLYDQLFNYQRELWQGYLMMF